MRKEDLRIVFLGTPDFAVESLRRIHEGGYNIVGVITMPDKIGGRGHKLMHSPVKEYALAHDLRLLQPVNLKAPQFIDDLRSLRADLFIVIAFRMLPREVWQMPRLGTFNLHASLLPAYRGAAPINRAVINGETRTGVTTFFLKHEIDTGDILAQEAIEIGPDENVGSVHNRLMLIGADLTVKTIEDILADRVRPVPQDELIGDVEPTPAPKIFKPDCYIAWDKTSREVHNLVRGLSPYPGAWTTLDGAEVKIFEAAPAEPFDGAPGDISLSDDGRRLFVRTADGALEVLQLQVQGKRRMVTADWLRGARLADRYARFQ